MKQKVKVKKVSQGGLFRRVLPYVVILLVAVIGVWLLTASHADSLPCGSVVDNKISFQVCPIAGNNQLITKVTATSHFFGLVPTNVLMSVQQCDTTGNNCNNIVTTSGTASSYTDTGNAVWVIQSNPAKVTATPKYRVCAFVSDSTGWNGGACSVVIAGSLLYTAPTTPTTSTGSGSTSTTTTTTTRTPNPEVTTAPPTSNSVPTPPTAAQTAATTAAQNAALLAKFYEGIQNQQLAKFYQGIQNQQLAKFYQGVQQQQATAFLTSLNNMCPSPRPLLAPGSYGSCVKFLQFFLNVKANAHLAVDGSYGPATISAVLNYQRAHGLSADGITGNQTWTYLLTGQTVPVTQFPPATNTRSGGGGSGGSGGGGSTTTGGGSGGGGSTTNNPPCYQYASLYANTNNCVPTNLSICTQYAGLYANLSNCQDPTAGTPASNHRTPPAP